MGGSMGSVVGEKIARLGQRSLERKYPLIIVSASGGARMQEGVLSLMQMAKMSAVLAQLAERRIPYISILTNPTTGGVSASYAMLGDAILAEPGAVIGFAGPRVIKQTLGQDLPEGFQTAEFLLDHGMLDSVVHRRELKRTVSQLLRHMSGQAGGDGVGDALSAPRRTTATRSTISSRARPADSSSASSGPSRCSSALGDPHRRYPSFHVAGTNGKGSSVRDDRGAARARKGLRVATYTSPHLVDFRERMLVDGAPIPAQTTSSSSSRAARRSSSDSARPSSRRRPRWRSTTSRAPGVDVAVIEAGLGGRLDSTNVARPARRRRHVDRHRPHRVPRRHARGDRGREGGHLQARPCRP